MNDFIDELPDNIFDEIVDIFNDLSIETSGNETRAELLSQLAHYWLSIYDNDTNIEYDEDKIAFIQDLADLAR